MSKARDVLNHLEAVQEDVGDIRALVGAIDKEFGGPEKLAKMLKKMVDAEETSPSVKAKLFADIMRIRTSVVAIQPSAMDTEKDIEAEIQAILQELREIEDKRSTEGVTV